MEEEAMKRHVNRSIATLLVSTLALGACATTDNGRIAMETFGRGLVNLVLSPLMIIGGLAQGIAFLPYTIATGLGELNRALLDAQAVSLDDSYKATFGVSIEDPRVNQKTGEVASENVGYGRHRPEAMLEATHAFQRLLISQGMPEASARHYVLAGVYTHVRTRGHILLSVTYRHTAMQPFRAISKHTGIVTTFRPEHMGWREPYEKDVDGIVVDEAIDWAGFEYALLRQDKLVATLMAIGAESVKSGKRAPDYWQVERRWIAGESAAIMRESTERVRKALPS
jgi:hypothetical protein